MLKYVETFVGLREVPDEIALCINLSQCPNKCPNCHSSYLAEDIGEELTFERLQELIRQNEGITTIAFMGGDNDPDAIWTLGLLLESHYPNLKSAWYSGKQNMPDLSPELFFRGIPFDYLKLGPYIEEKGPLNSSTTNQQMWKIDKNTGKAEDITYKFWKYESKSSK